jgi:o-succinylbenzoate synthase
MNTKFKYLISWKKHTLNFKFNAKTSRGNLKHHSCYIIQISSSDMPSIIGLGEASPLAGLSIDYSPNFEEVLDKYCLLLSQQELNSSTITEIIPPDLPSIRFGFETALLDLEQGGQRQLFNFSPQFSIPINGLIWMGDLAFMQQQIDVKLSQGYNCLKFKVGGLNFDQEFDLIQALRNRYNAQDLIIRLDANGAYSKYNVEKVLNQWSLLDIHSIEQPIKQGKYELMAYLCQNSPIDIALDEELIGVDNYDDRKLLLETIKPAYIILKPTLLGGFNAVRQWIDLAESLSIKWWLTSALESNIALNTISQFAAQYNLTLHQGLGTGDLYHNNLCSKHKIESGYLFLS